MPKEGYSRGSLVLYKGRPARVLQVDDKIEIELEPDRTVRVRPKDITLLHPGPLSSLDDLQQQEGEVKTAWELLAGTTTTLAELAELAYGHYTPLTSWSAWQLVEDGLYFLGEPGEILARSEEDLAEEQAARKAKAAAEKAWQDFLERARAGQILPEDSRYLWEVEELALGQRDNSRVMAELGHTERPESAHALLLRLGYWDQTVNPYPQRFILPTGAPLVVLPELPQADRIDLTHLPAFAIDDEESQDPDDALSLEGNTLWVHIADPAALISPDSPADREARARTSTLYLPEGMVPMLPIAAIERLGLGLGDVSPALSFRLELTPDTQILGVEIVPTWVRVTRMTYEEVEGRLDEEPFHGLWQLAQAFEKSRRERGAVHIELPEVKVLVQEDGRVMVRPLPPLRSRDLVREAMLMAGRAVAGFALNEGIPLPFTSQDQPESFPSAEAEGMAGMFALRRTMMPSQQSSVPAPHAGLGLDLYVQATSPMRRYLDLIVHQQLRAYLQGRELLGNTEILERVGATSAVSRSLRQAERLSIRHWTLVYLMQHPDWHGEGILVEKRSRNRGTILIPDLDLNVHLHLRQDLPLNSTVLLKVRGLNLPELDVHFQFA